MLLITLEAPDFNTDIVVNYLQNSDYIGLTQRLKEAFKLQRDVKGVPLRFAHSEEVIGALQLLLRSFNHLPLHNDVRNLMKELFIALRNYVVNPKVQTFLAVDEDFLGYVKVCMVKVSHDLSNTDKLQAVLQFLINLIVQNEAASIAVFNLFITSAYQLLKMKKCVKEASALLYNLSLYKSLDCLDAGIYRTVFDCYNLISDNEFLHFLLESFLTNNRFWENYKNLALNNRLITLEIVRDKQIKKIDVKWPESAVKILTDKFITSSQIIFQTAVTTNDLEAYEVSLMLEVLSSLCANETSLKVFQNDKNFLVNIGVLLINIHRLGKVSENCFSSIQKLSEVREPTEIIKQHPAFGFKGGLIRIVGNLCWKNKVMQDLTREAELIPVILDCCNIDARNPFIMQWAILAIRNACENNSKNQAVIAGMHQQGSVSSSALKEMGLTLHHDGSNSLKMVPLELLRKQ